MKHSIVGSFKFVVYNPVKWDKCIWILFIANKSTHTLRNIFWVQSNLLERKSRGCVHLSPTLSHFSAYFLLSFLWPFLWPYWTPTPSPLPLPWHGLRRQSTFLQLPQCCLLFSAGPFYFAPCHSFAFPVFLLYNFYCPSIWRLFFCVFCVPFFLAPPAPCCSCCCAHCANSALLFPKANNEKTQRQQRASRAKTGVFWPYLGDGQGNSISFHSTPPRAMPFHLSLSHRYCSSAFVDYSAFLYCLQMRKIKSGKSEEKRGKTKKSENIANLERSSLKEISQGVSPLGSSLCLHFRAYI